MADITNRHFYCLAKESNLYVLDPYKHGIDNKLLFYPHLKEAIDAMPPFAENEIYSVYVPTMIDKLKIYDAEYGTMIADEPIRVKFCGLCKIEKDADYFDRFEKQLIVDEYTINLAKTIRSEYKDNGPLNDLEDFSYLLDHTPMERIFLTSDWHLFKEKYKKEKNKVNIDKIIDWCQDNIKPSDIFMYLGDISYRFASLEDQQKSTKIMNSIPGHKCLILGNHDVFIGQNYYKDAGFDYVFEEYEWRNIIFSHRPLKMELDKDKINIHGHMHEEVTYRTSKGDHHLNVYPYFFDNKPVSLKYLLDHKEELMKDHVWQTNYGYGESMYPIGNYCKYSDNAIIHEIMSKYRVESKERSVVYYSKNIDSKTIKDMIEKLSIYLKGKVAIKLHFGEKGNENYLGPELLKDSIKYLTDNNHEYALVDCNTAYGGSRDNTEDHFKVAKDHGFSDNYIVDILDSSGGILLANFNNNRIEKEIKDIDDDTKKPYESKLTSGKHIKEIEIGNNIKNYDSMIVYTHFKGHEMAGYGGAIKNIGMGLATGKIGKKQIHGNWKADPLFLERLTESASVINSYFDGKIIYINILANISLECDCHGNKDVKPVMGDIGILASNDIIAIEQASLDLLRNAKDNKELIDQIANRGGMHVIDYGVWLGMGNREYILKDIDSGKSINIEESASTDKYYKARWQFVTDFENKQKFREQLVNKYKDLLWEAKNYDMFRFADYGRPLKGWKIFKFNTTKQNAKYNKIYYNKASVIMNYVINNINRLGMGRAYGDTSKGVVYFDPDLNLIKKYMNKYVTESNIDESLLWSDDDLVYNIDKFLSGETNIALVIGFSGSGKSTISRLMSINSNLTVFCSLDTLVGVFNGNININKAPYIIKEYYNQVGFKIIKSINYLDYSTYNYKVPTIYFSFMNWIIDFANSHKSNKFVIEGIWPLCFSDSPSRYVDKCVIIKGTSWLKSTYRAANRDQANQDSIAGLPKFGNAFSRLLSYITRNHYRFDNKDIMLKKIEEWRKYFNARLIVSESSNISDNISNHKYIHVSQDLNLDGKIFTPRIPNCRMIGKNMENGDIPRICFSEGSVDDALAAIVNYKYYKNFTNRKYAIYTPENNDFKKMTNQEIVNNKYVFDAHVTKEMWALEPVKIKKVCEIFVTSEILNEVQFYNFNDKSKGIYKYRIFRWFKIKNKNLPSV